MDFKRGFSRKEYHPLPQHLGRLRCLCDEPGTNAAEDITEILWGAAQGSSRPSRVIPCVRKRER